MLALITLGTFSPSLICIPPDMLRQAARIVKKLFGRSSQQNNVNEAGTQTDAGNAAGTQTSAFDEAGTQTQTDVDATQEAAAQIIILEQRHQAAAQVEMLNALADQLRTPRAAGDEPVPVLDVRVNYRRAATWLAKSSDETTLAQCIHPC